MSENIDTQGIPVGQRKIRHARQMATILLIGFALAVLTKTPETLFAAFVAGIGTVSGAFVYGNVKEHQATQTDISK